HADLEAAARAQFADISLAQLAEKLADRGEQALLLDADRGIAEARGEFQRIDAVRVDDAVDVDVAREARLREARLHLLQRGVEQAVGPGPEHRGAHLAGRGSDVSRKQLLVLEVDADRRDELAAV